MKSRSRNLMALLAVALITFGEGTALAQLNGRRNDGQIPLGSPYALPGRNAYGGNVGPHGGLPLPGCFGCAWNGDWYSGAPRYRPPPPAPHGVLLNRQWYY